MIRWGIIGCGSIAAKMANTIHVHNGSVLVAVAARDIDRAVRFAAAYGAEKAFGSYEELARDDTIDAVYIATIHPTHYEAARLCLCAGKAVLCEKPMTMTRTQAESLFELAHARGVLLMEGMWSRFLPAWQEVRQRVSAGEIGALRRTVTNFSISVGFDPESRLFNVEKGGGALLDLGVYALHTAVMIHGIDFIENDVIGQRSPTGSDSFARVTLRYANGQVAIASCGMDGPGDTSACIIGEKGYITLPSTIDADKYAVCIFGQEPQTVHHPYQHGFIYELEEFAGLLAAGALHSAMVPPAHTVAVMGIIEDAMNRIGYRWP